ncbi:ethanolamine ammonia-lyase small subunit [Tepidanaerobacter syntrophicus]|uniref:ethanolamine ammonia-lyase subunit EutC n=1 Tax=Tepidanaerobacter syntrophicus TaxID=224999 RepID=UPI0022EF7051|nr:ethanolamine ammonia-lyase subunit EutC [Tepidanaerobacter syntrophicus]GLI51761.1 ethanolamine ammonia-lyase small subunit [Tepidanaerobacter syntrophicus]
MTLFKDDEINNIVQKVLEELKDKADPDKACKTGENVQPNGEKVIEFSDITEYSLLEKVFVKNPMDEEFLLRIKKTTPARICIGRTGPRYLTIPWLRFRADHASAMDAVFSDVSEEFLNKMGLFSVQTVVKDKDEYLTRPDLGKILSEEAKEEIKKRCKMQPQIQVIVVDGLSSKAIEANVPDFLPALLEGLKTNGLDVGTPFFIKYGRVPVMDDVNEVIKADVVVELIGERPGLGTATSMSAYLCWRPKRGTVESDRNVVSNIHAGGMPPVEAGAHVASLAKKIFDKQGSGVNVGI